MTTNIFTPRFIISWFVLVAASIFLYFVLSSMLTQIFLTSARNELKKMENRVDIKMTKDHFMMRDYFLNLMSYQKKIPDIHESKGDFYLSLAKTREDSLFHMRGAVVAYRDAINLAPANARYWVKFAHAKALSNQFDKEFYFSYQRAFYYGGWENHINRALMEIGMAYWYSMNIDSRLILKQAVIRSYAIKAHPVLEMGQQYGQLKMICLWVRGEKNKHRICEHELAD